MNRPSRIQYISDGKTLEEQKFNISKALDAGVNWIQLRWKNYRNINELHQLAAWSRTITQTYNSLLIINDHIQLVMDVEANGVHLGLGDDSIHSARKLLGESKIIGGTANSYADVIQRCSERCDYIGLGPLRFTSTKKNLSPILGFSGYKTIVQTLKKNKISSPPIYAIGGIQEADIEEILLSGIYGIAISSLIQKDPNAFKRMNHYYEKEYTENCR